MKPRTTQKRSPRKRTPPKPGLIAQLKRTKSKQELALLNELLRTHGYGLFPLCKHERPEGTVVALPSHRTRPAGSSRLVQFVKLAVPDDSALGLLLQEARRPHHPHLARPRPRSSNPARIGKR